MNNSTVFSMMIAMLCLSFPLDAQLEFVQHVVTEDFTLGADVIAVDLDQDGHMDIAATNSNPVAEVAWWKNDGDNGFTKITILDNLNKGRSLRAADINGDGETDLVVAVYGENRIVYLENQGEASFLGITVDAEFTGAHTIDLKDADGDNDLDIFCSGFDYYGHNGEIAWWENDGNDPIGWTRHLISDRFQQSPFIYGEDMDGDGDMDVIACGELNDEILWWENDGAQNFTEHMVDNLIDGIHTVIARDVDLDGDMDILAAACIGSRVVWYENDGLQGFVKHDLGYCAGALWLDAADLDNDGDNDLFAAPQGAANLCWWENPGDQQFIKHIIDSPFTQSFCIVPTYMDDDDDIDLVAIGWQSNKISWFENRLEALNLLNNPESVVYDAAKNRYLVSNWGNGDIIAVDSLGKHQYFNRQADHLAGLHIAGGMLFASSNGGTYDGLLGFNLQTGELEVRVEITGKGVLNDITSDKDDNLYITDSQDDKIYRVKAGDTAFNVFVDSGLGDPNGIWYDEPNDRLLVLNESLPYKPVVAISLEDSSTYLVVETGISSIDGLTGDGKGNFYFSSWQTDCIYRYDETFTNPPEMVSSGHTNPADIYYNQADDMLAVPNFSSDMLELIPMGTTSLPDIRDQGMPLLSVFPNPFSSHLMMKYTIRSACHVEIRLYNLAGQQLSILDDTECSEGDYSLDLSRTNACFQNLEPGIYFCKFKAGNQSSTVKLIKTD